MARSRTYLILSTLTVVLGLATLSLLAQDTPSARKAANSNHRVPVYFSKVGVTPDQKAKIYAVRDKYADKIAELEKQISDLKVQELAECEKVLTDAQKQLLRQYRDSSGRKTRGAAAAPPAPAPEPAKPAAPPEPEKPKS